MLTWNNPNNTIYQVGLLNILEQIYVYMHLCVYIYIYISPSSEEVRGKNYKFRD